jgi:hypothetical protein
MLYFKSRFFCFMMLLVTSVSIAVADTLPDPGEYSNAEGQYNLPERGVRSGPLCSRGCPNDSVAVGISVAKYSDGLSIQGLHCQAMRTNGRFRNPSSVYFPITCDAPHSIPPRSMQVDLICPSGTMMVGWTGRYSNYLTALGPRCATPVMTNDGRITGVNPFTGNVVGNLAEGNAFTDDCTNGMPFLYFSGSYRNLRSAHLAGKCNLPSKPWKPVLQGARLEPSFGRHGDPVTLTVDIDQPAGKGDHISCAIPARLFWLKREDTGQIEDLGSVLPIPLGQTTKRYSLVVRNHEPYGDKPIELYTYYHVNTPQPSGHVFFRFLETPPWSSQIVKVSAPSNVFAQQPFTVEVFLDHPAPRSGVRVGIDGPNSFFEIPANTTIPEGATSVSVRIKPLRESNGAVLGFFSAQPGTGAVLIPEPLQPTPNPKVMVRILPAVQKQSDRVGGKPLRR